MTDDLTIPILAVPTVRPRKFREFIARHELVVFFTLAFVFSWYPWVIALVRGRSSGPNPLGPFIAALIVAGITRGWTGIRELLGRMVRARIGLKWYAIIFGLPILLCAVALAIMAAVGQPIVLPTAEAGGELPERLMFIFFLLGAGL